MARHLGSVVPPLPIPEKEVALNWKKVYLNDNLLLSTMDYVIAGWQMAGVLGETTVAGKFFMIGSKSFIAGEDGAYMYLVRKDRDFDAASAYLKDPAQAQTFAHLVDDVRQHQTMPASADPAMVQAARAITDPRLGNNNWGIAWDAMTSPEALSAMIRKASIEATSELISAGATPGINKLLANQQERKTMFDAIRLERAEARAMMKLPTTTDVQRAQLTGVIEKADQLSADVYRFEKGADRVVDTAAGLAIGDATDGLAKAFLPSEAKGPK